MKENATRLNQILSTNEEFGYFGLLRLDWNATHFYTSLAYNVTFKGNEYISDPTIMELQSPNYSEVTDRELYTFNLNGANESLLNEVRTGILHRPVQIHLGFTVSGEPQLGNDDTLLIYKGEVANPRYYAKDGQQLLSIECSAPLSNLDETGGIFTTKDFMKNIDPTDTCFDYIVEGSSKKTNIKWGKI